MILRDKSSGGRSGETANGRARKRGKRKTTADLRYLTLAPDSQGETEACFLKAIAVAQKQQAKSLELRAVMNLVRLRQRQVIDHDSRMTDHATRSTQHASRSRLDEEHEMLSEVYDWFTEGFETKDLQEARTLLEGLTTN